MLKVALTGGIATGKSHVLARIRDRGVPTIDADEVVHEMLGPATPTTKAIATQFGSVFLRPDGGIDRTLLGTKVFSDPESRLRLEAIIHPVVYETIRKWYETLDRPMGVASIPLLYETHREGDFDFVVVTVCPLEQQLQRILVRDRVSEEEARQRIAAQMPAGQKAERGNFVIDTGGTHLGTDRQIDELLIALHNLLP
jgi:dephospho-CoA kinase